VPLHRGIIEALLAPLTNCQVMQSTPVLRKILSTGSQGPGPLQHEPDTSAQALERPEKRLLSHAATGWPYLKQKQKVCRAQGCLYWADIQAAASTAIMAEPSTAGLRACDSLGSSTSAVVVVVVRVTTIIVGSDLPVTVIV